MGAIEQMCMELMGSMPPVSPEEQKQSPDDRQTIAGLAADFDITPTYKRFLARQAGIPSP
jgi:hypothetical protein